jgi:lipoate-protein ligase A
MGANTHEILQKHKVRCYGVVRLANQMHPVRLLDLGHVSPLHSQTVYHAVGYAMTPVPSGVEGDGSRDTVILVSPDRPYVCIGYHQELEKEVDLGYCHAHGLPVYRREVGGGAVYLDDGQLFVQWAFHGGHLPADLAARFELYVRPLVETYRALGIPAYLRPINDVHVGGKKIGGTGAAQMGEAEIMVGSLMFTFDKATMARVLKVPSEKMRDKVFQSLEQYMTTMQEQLGSRPDRETVKRLYIERCAAALGREIVPGDLTSTERAVMAELDARFVSGEWLHAKGGLKPLGVKIHEDVRVVEGTLKAPGGLIRVTARLCAGTIDDIALSGDFTVLPATGVAALERALSGASLVDDPLRTIVQAVYRELALQSPGVTPEHLVDAILAAASQ